MALVNLMDLYLNSNGKKQQKTKDMPAKTIDIIVCTFDFFWLRYCKQYTNIAPPKDINKK